MRRAGLLLVAALVLAGCGDDGDEQGAEPVTPEPELLDTVVDDVQATLRELDVTSNQAEELACRESTADPFVRLVLERAFDRAEVVAHLRTYGWSPVEGLARGPGELVLVRRYLAEPGFEDPGFEDEDPRPVEATLTLRADEVLVRVVDPPPCA